MIITVKAARINAGISQKQAAEALELLPKSYARKENGKGKFYAHELAVLSRLYNVSLLNFFEAGCHNMTQPGA